MTCDDVAARLTALADGELSGDASAELESHIAGCVRCAGAYTETRAVSAMANAWQVEPRSVLDAIAHHIGPAVYKPVQDNVQFPAPSLAGPPADLVAAIDHAYREAEGAAAMAAMRVATSAPGDPGEPGRGQASAIERMAQSILIQAIHKGVSDIHIEPDRRSVRVRYRVDGVLHEAMAIPKHIQAPLIDRFKILSDMNIAERRVPQEGTLRTRHEDGDARFRVFCTPSAEGERLTLHFAGREEPAAPLPEAADLRGVLEEMRRMRAEMRGLRAEVAGLRQQLAARPGTPQRPSPPPRLFPHATTTDAPFRLL